MIAVAVLACVGSFVQGSASPTPWERVVAIDSHAIETESDFDNALRDQKLATAGYTNWFTGRWPNISFIGGMAMGNVSEDLEFFYEKPFKWSTRVLDYVMEGGGRKFGIRATIRPYRNQGVFPGHRSYLLRYRCDRLLEDYHPSYILVNGRRVWDSRIHPILDGKIVVPFWQEAAGNPVIDFVTDLDATPNVKGLALRMFQTEFLGVPGDKVSLKDASEKPETSPANAEKRFAFGVFPTDVDFWSDKGDSIEQLEQLWKPNFRPTYPTDTLWLSPFTAPTPAKGMYHDFMVTYGGCNILGSNPGPDIVAQTAAYARGILVNHGDPNAAKQALKVSAGLEVHWFGEDESPLMPDSLPQDPGRLKALTEARNAVQSAKVGTGAPDRIQDVIEPFPPALSSAYEFSLGHDVLVLKNEEDPQYNILMAMARGAGNAYGKPFGFYWEQTHYPYPSLEFKLQACLLYYFAGGSWIGAEAENAPSFDDGVVAEWVMPYIKALRFAMVHPARGKPIVPTAICWGDGDRWWVPYSPLGQMDTFQRSISYDNATGVIDCEPAFIKPLPWMPAERKEWDFESAGHLAYFADHISDMKGYNLLDVYFPGFGDAFTARIAGLLTGTPQGPVDFLDIDKASDTTLQGYGVSVFLGHAAIDASIREKLLAAAEAGQTIVLGAQHIGEGHALAGLRIPLRNPQPLKGEVDITPGLLSGKTALSFDGRVYLTTAPDWEIVASVGDPEWPLLVRRSIGKGMIYVFLGQWMNDGGSLLRPLLKGIGQKTAPILFGPADDQLEYVVYKKGGGAWAAVFNHSAIPIGSDRLKELRATPPEPLCSKVKGPWKGEVAFRLDRLGLDASKPFGLYEIDGIDGPMFDRVVSGKATFAIKPIPFVIRNGEIRAKVQIAKRAEFVVAPPGHAHDVFFGAAR
jgi:hypothetical protein